MSNITAAGQITTMQTQTAMAEAARPRATGTNELGSDAFLKLMLLQLQNQDPTSPMDNKDFLAQQAQFTQVDQTQKLTAATALNNAVMQSLALVGKSVTLTDPDDAKKTITGVVSQASFADGKASINVNGKDYPMSLVVSVKEVAKTP